MSPNNSSMVLSPSTKVPFGWMITGFVGTAGIVLFLANIQTQNRVNESSIQNVEKRVSIIEQDLKEELRSIRSELVKLNQNKHKE